MYNILVGFVNFSESMPNYDEGMCRHCEQWPCVCELNKPHYGIWPPNTDN